MSSSEELGSADFQTLDTYVRHSTMMYLDEIRHLQQRSFTSLVRSAVILFDGGTGRANAGQWLVRSDTGEGIDFPPPLVPIEIQPLTPLQVNISHETADSFMEHAMRLGADLADPLSDWRFTGPIVDDGTHYMRHILRAYQTSCPHLDTRPKPTDI